MLKGIWFSYDLGVDGYYEELYYWLDKNRSKECGDSVAFFQYTYETNLVKELSSDLKSQVKLRAKDRIYIIYQDGKSFRGKFLFGKRKRAPWEGFSEFGDEGEDES